MDHLRLLAPKILELPIIRAQPPVPQIPTDPNLAIVFATDVGEGAGDQLLLLVIVVHTILLRLLLNTLAVTLVHPLHYLQAPLHNGLHSGSSLPPRHHFTRATRSNELPLWS